MTMFHTPFSLPDLFQDIRQELSPVLTPLPSDRWVVRRPTPNEEDDMTWITTAAEQVSFLMRDDAPVFVSSQEQSDTVSDDDVIVIDDTVGIFGKLFAKISALFACK